MKAGGAAAARTGHRLPRLSTGSVPSLLTGGREHEAREWRGAAVPEWGPRRWPRAREAQRGWGGAVGVQLWLKPGGRGFREGPGQRALGRGLWSCRSWGQRCCGRYV